MWLPMLGAFIAAELVFFGVIMVGTWLIHRSDVEVESEHFYGAEATECGDHELTKDCWCNPRVLVVEGAT